MSWRTLATALLLAALAAWAAWEREATLSWSPFNDPSLVQVVPVGEEHVTSDLQSGGGRLHAARDLDIVFRRGEGARALTLVGGRGRLRLFLGAEGPALGVADGRLALLGSGKRATAERPTGPEGERLTLRWNDGRVTVLAGERTLLTDDGPVPPPEGRVGVHLLAGTSLERLELEGASGRAVLAPPVAANDRSRALWAAGAVFLLVIALVRWGRAAVGHEPGGRPASLLTVGVLAAGLGVSLYAHDRERMRPPEIPISRQPLGPTGLTRVDLFRSFEVQGRTDADFDLTATVTLEGPSVLSVLLRGTSTDSDRGIVLTLSSDPRLASGIARNTSLAWEERAAPEALATLPEGRPLALEVQARGATVSAAVDGRDLGSVTDLDLRAGRTAFQVLTGGAEVSGLAIRSAGEPRDLTGVLATWIALAAGGALLLAAALARVGRPRAAAGTTLAPLAVVAWPAAPAWTLVPGALLTLGLVVLWAPTGRRLIACALGLALVLLAGGALAEAPPDVTPTTLNQLAPWDVPGGPLDTAFLWARHPLLRRFDPFVRDHCFRSGPVRPLRPPARRRVVALGSSSTYGYGVDAGRSWSAVLARRYGGALDMVNAGVPGATAERLRYLLQGLIAGLSPDLVIVDLSFNDHVQGALDDERAYFDQWTREGVSPLEAWWHRVRERDRRAAWGAYYRARCAGEEVAPEDTTRFETEPAQRFAASLQDIVSLCRAAGAEVVFVQEPSRDLHQDPVLATYHRTMAELAERLELPVVDPQPELDALGSDAFIDAVHPTVEGHRALAAAIVRGLGPEGLLPGRR